MRICLLCYRANPYSGGQGIYLKYVAEEMVRQGHQVHAVVGPPYPSPMKDVTLHKVHNKEYYIRRGRNVIDAAEPFSVLRPLDFYEYCMTRVRAFPEISTFSLRAFRFIRALHESHNFDVIHDNQSLGYGLLLLKSLGIPIVATIHHPLTIDMEAAIERADDFMMKARAVMFYPTLMQSFVAKRLDHILTVSEDSKNRIRSDFGVSPARMSVAYNGIDRNIFRPLPGIKRKKGKIVFVGNVEDGKKGFVYLLKAMTGIDRSVQLTAVDGGSPHRRVTSRLIKKLGIEDRVEFTGKTSTEELVRHYNESEIAIVPSVYEGFGLPAAEAMSCGVPVIASDGGALREVVADAGIVVPARDEAAIADAINRLIADRQRLGELAEKGIERVKQNFTWEKSVMDIIDSYRRLIDS